VQPLASAAPHSVGVLVELKLLSVLRWLLSPYLEAMWKMIRCNLETSMRVK
jgi:hypothetical protein